MKHLDVFDGGNSFANFSLLEDYSEVFGFSQKEVEDNDETSKVIDHLLEKHKSQIPKKYLQKSQEDQRKHFISELFENYNGFYFTQSNFQKKMFLISPISLMKQLEDLYSRKAAINPYEFQNYWGTTSGTRYIKLLGENEENPISSHKILKKAIQSGFDLQILLEQHSSSKIPLKLLLFNTGYLTIKKLIKGSIVELDWTNQEAKESFYKLYVEDLKYNGNEILKPLQNNEMGKFLKLIEDYFLRMLKKHYSIDYNDDEHNQVLLFFKELLSHVKEGREKLQIYDRYRLAGKEMKITYKQIPDLIFIYEVSKKSKIENQFEKKCLILDFYKK